MKNLSQAGVEQTKSQNRIRLEMWFGLFRLSAAHPVEPVILVDHLDAEFGGLLELRAGAGPATTRSVLPETEPATLAPRRSAIAFASERVIFSSEPVNTTVLPATGAVGGNGHDIRLRAPDLRQQSLEHLVVALIAEEVAQRSDDRVADAVDDGNTVCGSSAAGDLLADADQFFDGREGSGQARLPSSRRCGGCRARR